MWLSMRQNMNYYVVIPGSPSDMLHLYHITAASCYRIHRIYEHIMTITTQPLLHNILTHKIALDQMRNDISSM